MLVFLILRELSTHEEEVELAEEETSIPDSPTFTSPAPPPFPPTPPTDTQPFLCGAHKTDMRARIYL